jgi:hypothetical protein
MSLLLVTETTDGLPFSKIAIVVFSKLARSPRGSTCRGATLPTPNGLKRSHVSHPTQPSSTSRRRRPAPPPRPRP